MRGFTTPTACWPTEVSKKVRDSRGKQHLYLLNNRHQTILLLLRNNLAPGHKTGGYFLLRLKLVNEAQHRFTKTIDVNPLTIANAVLV